MTGPPPLAYFFWHWKQPAVTTARYESALSSFHASLVAAPPDGFVSSTSSAVRGAEWANAGGDAYLDRYILRDSSALDSLDDSIASVVRRAPHDTVASLAAAGVGGLSCARLGAPLTEPRFAYWFSKARGLAYADFLDALSPLVRPGESVLWMRRLVLGPSPEFCLESTVAIDRAALPPSIPLDLRPVWAAK